jgi:LysR family hydrogen peroxide-inducible transcriptional activator
MPSLLIEFRSNHPNIQVNLRTGEKQALQKLVSSGKIEVGVVTNPTRISGLVVEPFLKRELVGLVLASSPLARKRELNVAELAHHPLVIRGRREGMKVARILSCIESRGIKPNVFMYCDSANMLKTAVRETNGIGILYDDVIESDLSNGNFRLLKLSGLRLAANVSLVYRRDRPRSAPARDFLELLRQWSRSN